MRPNTGTDIRDQLVKSQEISDRLYLLEGMCRVRVSGADTPIGRVLDGTLGLFASEGGDPDLTISLGQFPSKSWKPSGFTVGDRLLYDSSSDLTTVFRRPTTSSLSKEEVEYVIQGDIRSSGSRVEAFVPSIPKRMGYFRSLMRGVARRSLSRTLLAAFGNEYIPMETVEQEAAKVRLAILEPFLFYRLPFRDSTLVHGSVVSFNGSGLLFTGGGHIGKTALSLEMVKRGFSYLGDDLAIVGRDGRAFPYPEPIRIQEQHLMLYPELRQALASKIGGRNRVLFNWMLRRSPGETLELIPRLKISEVFDGAKVGDPCHIDNALLIQKGTISQPSLEEIDIDSISKTVAAELFWEFETGHWRHNQYIYAPSSAKGSDFLSEEAEHRLRTRGVIFDSFRNTRTFRLQVPYEFKISGASVFVDKILRK
jgi:HPr serine kinase-like protein